MIGVVNSSSTFSLAAIQSLQLQANSDYISDLGTLIMDIDFSTHAVGNYTTTMQTDDFMTYNGENLHYNNHDGSSMIGDVATTVYANIVDDGTENVLDVLYDAGGYGYAGGGFLKVNALPKNNRPVEDVNNPSEITLTYNVKFVELAFTFLAIFIYLINEIG